MPSRYLHQGENVLHYWLFKLEITVLLLLYKIARNAVTLELISAKYAYEKDLAARIKTDNKLFWNYVSKNSKTKKSVSQLLSSDGTLTSSDRKPLTP